MELRVDDGEIIFAKWLIKFKVSDEVKNKLERFRVEDDGVVAYTDEERNEAEKILKELGIEYSVENIYPDDAMLAIASKVKKIAYSRSEVVDYIKTGKMPDRAYIMRREYGNERTNL